MLVKNYNSDFFRGSFSSYFIQVQCKIGSHGSLMRKACNVTTFCPWGKYTGYSLKKNAAINGLA